MQKFKNCLENLWEIFYIFLNFYDLIKIFYSLAF